MSLSDFHQPGYVHVRVKLLPETTLNCRDQMRAITAAVRSTLDHGEEVLAVGTGLPKTDWDRVAPRCG